MKIAKASEADIDMATELVADLELLGHHFFPCMPDAIEELSGEQASERFDEDDDAQCGRALRHLLRLLKKGSLPRVVWGMACVLNPKNRVVDPYADTLEVHPDLLRRVEAPESLRSALDTLYRVCVAMDLVNQMERPTEDQYQAAIGMAGRALKATEPGREPEAVVNDLVKQALLAADTFGFVVEVTQMPLQPFAMGHYQTLYTVRPKRELASQAQAEQGGAA